MSFDRIQQLLAFKQEEPNDPFLWYSLALEYQKTDLALAEEHFVHLLKNHPDYVATYYHLAKLWVKMEKIDDAKAVYEKGMEVAQKVHDQHIFKELKSAYDIFLFEEYDD